MDRPGLAALFFLFAMCTLVSGTNLDPDGHIEITWDVLGWTTDGYTAQVTIENKQAYRGVSAPGWWLGWAWADGEIIQSAYGAEATMQGDCSNHTTAGATAPHSCESYPVMVDLLPTADTSLTYANCCRSGVLTTDIVDSTQTTSMFEIIVANAGSDASSVVAPANFTFLGNDYQCTNATVSSKSLFAPSSGRHYTMAFLTYKINCTYVQAEAEPFPGCCVSLSAFYNASIAPCAECACGCGSFSSSDTLCTTDPTVPFLVPAASNITSASAPYARECSSDGCPISIHWHVVQNYHNYWEVLITISNRMLYQNYSDWTLTVEHPSLGNITQNDGFNSQNILPFGLNDTAIFFGKAYDNSQLVVAPGYVQTTLLLGKDSSFTLKDGWVFPKTVVFNGQTCAMPNWSPTLPSAAMKVPVPLALLSTALALMAFLLFGL